MVWTVNTTFKQVVAAATRTELLSGSLKLYSSTPTLLASIPISGIVDNADGTLTISFTAGVAGVGTGTAVRADLCDSGDTVNFTTTSVGTSASDVNLDDLAITTTKTITLSPATLSWAALVES